MGNFRPVTIEIKRWAVFLDMALGADFLLGPAGIRQWFGTACRDMLPPCSVAGFALHSHQVAGDIHINKTSGLIKTHDMAFDAIRVKGLVDVFQILIGDGVLAL